MCDERKRSERRFRPLAPSVGLVAFRQGGTDVDASAQRAQPETGACQRCPYAPASAQTRPGMERRDDADGHYVSGGMIERLDGQWPRESGRERLSLRSVESGRRLDERIEPAPPAPGAFLPIGGEGRIDDRSEEHTSELQSLMRISYAVFCLKKKT